MNKRQLNGSLQEPEKRTFTLFGTANFFNLVAADGTEFVQLAPAPSQPMDAGVTHDLAAMCALVSDSGVLMARTDQGTVCQHNGRGGFGIFKLRDCNVNICGLNEQFHISQTQSLSGGKSGFSNGLSIDESAVS